jgi:hypothetical protein
MITTQCSFEEMLEMSTKLSGLGIAASFFQVEFGLDELRACWDGFLHTSSHYGVEFQCKTDVCEKFTDALTDYREYLDSNEVGLPIH